MSGFGAIVKSITRAIEDAVTAAEHGLRAALGNRRPKPYPVTVNVENDRRRRRR